MTKRVIPRKTQRTTIDAQEELLLKKLKALHTKRNKLVEQAEPTGWVIVDRDDKQYALFPVCKDVPYSFEGMKFLGSTDSKKVTARIPFGNKEHVEKLPVNSRYGVQVLTGTDIIELVVSYWMYAFSTREKADAHLKRLKKEDARD